MISEKYEQIREQLGKSEKDVAEVAKGNASAGTRVRKAMQEVKRLAQEIRQDVLALKKP